MSSPSNWIAPRSVKRFGVLASWMPGMYMVRVAGWGVHVKDLDRHRKLFSEREGVWVQWQVGSWLVTPLKRGDRGLRRADAPDIPSLFDIS